MKKNQILLLAFLAFHFLGFNQSTRQHTVYFQTDKHVIPNSEQKKLDGFIAELQLLSIKKIELTGHTDSDGSNPYNLDLSKRRVETVRGKLSELNLPEESFTTGFFGEEKPTDLNTSSKGKQNNRRVNILVEFIAPREVVPPPISELIPDVAEEPEITGDTMIVLRGGTCMVVDRKGYLEGPNCISVVEYVDGESIRESGLTTMASDGSTLISAGMFDVKMCDESKCMKLLVPVRTVCGQRMPFSQWVADDGNTWSQKTSTPLPIRMINEKPYYEMSICGSGSINCDVKTPDKSCKLFRPKTRIKLKDGYRVKNIQLATDEPMVLENPVRKRKKKAVFYRTCPCTDPLVKVEVTNKKGETKVIEFRPLNEFDKREAFGKCKTDETEKKILFFKIKKKTKYRKYIIRKSDFVGKN